ncbi:unnamed protein product [Sphenostylis stenocarpa]|uniref:Uncharacterized protein n=1 Tax=Sphenostylis stenocarpa TaxID=92480 RepID=A0AA86VYQ0_9FABA|nr:unnamed protein product [Sphenostylis stenocarpa]
MSNFTFNLRDAAGAPSSEELSDLVHEIAEKLGLYSQQHKNFRKTLTPNVRKRVDYLKGLQKQYDEFAAKFFEERLKLEAKYLKLYEPLYLKRYEIVNGVKKVEGVTDEADKATEANGVPNFWLTAMKNNETLAKEARNLCIYITGRDEGALTYLRDIKWCRIDDPKGFKLDFFFVTNPYFKNARLTKTYYMVDDDERVLEKAIGTEIKWVQERCLTQKLLRKRRRKGSKNVKFLSNRKRCESFFNFFNPPQVPEDDADFDDDDLEKLQNLIEQDYDIGCILRDKIIPHAVSWFTGEAVRRDYNEIIEGEKNEEAAQSDFKDNGEGENDEEVVHSDLKDNDKGGNDEKAAQSDLKDNEEAAQSDLKDNEEAAQSDLKDNGEAENDEETVQNDLKDNDEGENDEVAAQSDLKDNDEGGNDEKTAQSDLKDNGEAENDEETAQNDLKDNDEETAHSDLKDNGEGQNSEETSESDVTDDNEAENDEEEDANENEEGNGNEADEGENDEEAANGNEEGNGDEADEGENDEDENEDGEGDGDDNDEEAAREDEEGDENEDDEGEGEND